MELQQRLNKIASDFRLNGSQTAGLAVAACVLLDINNDVALDGRNLSATMDRLLAAGAVALGAVIDARLVTGQTVFVVPTTDPEVEGALWNDGGAVVISEGPAIGGNGHLGG